MKLVFQSQKLGNLINNYEALCKKFDTKTITPWVPKLDDVFEALRAAETLADVPPKPYNPRSLQGKEDGHFSVEAVGGHTIKFQPNPEDNPFFKSEDHRTVTSVIITGIESKD